MILLRSFAVYLLVLTLLPWGAYSTAKAAQQPLLALQVLSIPDPCQDADTPGAQPRLAALPQGCRSGILVGSSCGADPAVFASAPAPDMTRTLHIRFPHTVACFVSIVPTRMLDPPRGC